MKNVFNAKPVVVMWFDEEELKLLYDSWSSSQLSSIHERTGPFFIQSEENRALARHCSISIEPMISGECITLLHTQVNYDVKKERIEICDIVRRPGV
ncbi:unnamed protein product [Trifolium pratense]|uniref:Uncharacterized protein n=1 Tax=Trifolium pratense TaxID=57577 RepID=A0ACB0LU68_TRIPR|nr:unnamed protein product [Trifolium pratense]